MRIERRKIIIIFMTVTPTGIGLPNLKQGPRHTLTVFIQNAPMHQNTRAHGTVAGRCGVGHQIRVPRTQNIVAKNRPCHIRYGVG